MDPLQRAVQELNEQNYGSAIWTLEMLTARDPSNADAWKHLTQAYFHAGQREKAAEAAQRYAALRPTDAAGHYNAGMLLSELGQEDAAVRALRAALAADPGHAKARRALAKLEGVDEETGAPAALAVVPARPPENVRRKMPWQAKVAAALTVLAALAILLWLFLPGGRARPGAPTQNPQPSPNPITTPAPNQPSATQPNLEETPTPTDQPQVQPLPDGTVPTPSPQPNPNQPLPDNEQPSNRAPGSTSTPKPIFTPQQAQQVAEQMDAAEREQVQGQLRYLANWLRNDPSCKDTDFWPILQASLATSGPSMVPGGASIGTGEVMALITNAQTNVQAADSIEAYSKNLKTALPWNVKQQIAQALALATNANEAYTSVQQVLKQSNTTLSQQANQVLQQTARQAEQTASPAPH
jgi:tetratricopeptide (TPR) repeat protein